MADLGKAKPGVRNGEHHIRKERVLQASSDAVAINGGNHRSRITIHRDEQVVKSPHPIFDWIGGRPVDLLDVATRAEETFSGARGHHRRRIAFSIVPEESRHCEQQCTIQRVGRRPIEDCDHDAVAVGPAQPGGRLALVLCRWKRHRMRLCLNSGNPNRRETPRALRPPRTHTPRRPGVIAGAGCRSIATSTSAFAFCEALTFLPERSDGLPPLGAPERKRLKRHCGVETEVYLFLDQLVDAVFCPSDSVSRTSRE